MLYVVGAEPLASTKELVQASAGYTRPRAMSVLGRAQDARKITQRWSALAPDMVSRPLHDHPFLQEKLPRMNNEIISSSTDKERLFSLGMQFIQNDCR